MLATFKDCFGGTERIYNKLDKVLEDEETVVMVPRNYIDKSGTDVQEKENVMQAAKEGKIAGVTGNIGGHIVKGDGGIAVDKKTQWEPIRSIYSIVRAGPTLKNNWEGGNVMD